MAKLPFSMLDCNKKIIEISQKASFLILNQRSLLLIFMAVRNTTYYNVLSYCNAFFNVSDYIQILKWLKYSFCLLNLF